MKLITWIKQRDFLFWIVIGCVLLFSLIVFAGVEMDQYIADHHCKLTASTPATTGWVNGHSLYIAGHKTYLCDGGEVLEQ